MAPHVHRITMFKISSPEAQQSMIKAYGKMAAEQQKDGKPYILSMCSGPAHEDARSQGWNFVAKTEFASLEDMNFYDSACPAHQALKVTAAGLGVGVPLTIYYTAEPQIKL